MTNLTAQLEDERVIMPQASTYVRIPDDAAFRGETGPLPAGVRRVAPDELFSVLEAEQGIVFDVIDF